ncbi:IS4 family transposase, partial [bacterium]
KPIEEKESYKWLESLKETESMFSDKLQIMIADRESDIYDLFTMPRRKNSHFLIRASQNRLLKDIDKKLFTALEKADAKGNLVIEVGRKKGQDSRLANLTVKYERLSIKAPKNTPKEIKDVSLNAILVEEREFSDGIEPIKWILLTTLEIASLEDALKYVRWYSYRWLIERFHFVLKSGCQIEKLQLGSSEQIQKALAMYSIMSSIILFITYKARIEPDSSAEEIFTKKELKVLYLLTHKKEYTSKNTITFKDSILYIAKLGGFLARKSDGNPGLKTIWLGYRKFYDIIQGVNLIKHFKYINT